MCAGAFPVISTVYVIGHKIYPGVNRGIVKVGVCGATALFQTNSTEVIYAGRVISSSLQSTT